MNVKLIIFILGSLIVSHVFGLFTSENVVFQKTNEVFINDAHWSVIFVHDLRLFQNLISQIKNDLERTDEIVKTITNFYKRSNLTGYVETFERLHVEIDLLTDTYKSVYEYFDDSIVNGIGQIVIPHIHVSHHTSSRKILTEGMVQFVINPWVTIQSVVTSLTLNAIVNALIILHWYWHALNCLFPFSHELASVADLYMFVCLFVFAEVPVVFAFLMNLEQNECRRLQMKQIIAVS